MNITKGKMLYEGKAKQIFETNDDTKVIVRYKDDATAFNALKKGTIEDKGILNNKITSLLFKFLAEHGVESHFIKMLNEREQLCHKVSIMPIEVIVRNIIAGSMAKRLDIEEGTVPDNLILDLCYKRDDLGDPLINEHHAVALGAATYDELDHISKITKNINNLLRAYFLNQDIILVDFKIEFGKDKSGKIILADEISPDTCRFWDEKTMKKLDKDRFRRDLGDIKEAYVEILDRLS